MTALITPPHVKAYINHGRWIAECPFECGSARQLQPNEQTFHCSECQSVLSVKWPDNADEIWEVLAERRAPRTRNWFPVGHPLAEKHRLPTGQTVKELREEQKENEA